MLAVFEKGAASVQDIPQIEKFVMEDLFWSDTPMLQTIATHEGVTPACRSRFHAALLETLPPMAAYVALFEKYEPMVQMDVAAYMAEYTGQPVAKVEDDCDRDFFMTPEEAKDYGIIDEVLVSKVRIPSVARPELMVG